jgi:hypothetical protein
MSEMTARLLGGPCNEQRVFVDGEPSAITCLHSPIRVKSIGESIDLEDLRSEYTEHKYVRWFNDHDKDGCPIYRWVEPEPHPERMPCTR